MKSKFPVETEINEILRLMAQNDVADIVKNTLFKPIEDFFERPKKQFRGQIVELGYRLAGTVPADQELTDQQKAACQGCSEILEYLHAGSLVVDDIQDGSKIRRGKPALHLKYGLPVALNAGNWLYFWPLTKIRSLGLSAERELQLYQICNDTLLRAHFGQAIDVGVPIDSLPQDRIYSVCMASLELKSGALMALAITLGAVVAGASAERLQLLEKFGHQFGIALQMFDDVGNLKAKAEIMYNYTKKYEDLLLKRPSWIWAVVASSYPEKDFKDFASAVNHLPDESFLTPWLEIHELVSVAKQKAVQYLAHANASLEATLGNDGAHLVKIVKQLGERLAQAYD